MRSGASEHFICVYFWLSCSRRERAPPPPRLRSVVSLPADEEFHLVLSVFVSSPRRRLRSSLMPSPAYTSQSFVFRLPVCARLFACDHVYAYAHVFGVRSFSAKCGVRSPINAPSASDYGNTIFDQIGAISGKLCACVRGSKATRTHLSTGPARQSSH